MDDRQEALYFYATPGAMTDAGLFKELFTDLPDDIGRLCRVLQGILLHAYWAEKMGVALSDEDRQAVGIRPVAERLALIHKRDERPLAEAREPASRLVGNCRDFALTLCAILRSKGIPARARCGFARYFEPGWYEDHWICEYWRPEEKRWVQVDAQLDAVQLSTLNIVFDPTDLPPGQFLPGGAAWRLCRSGQADPDRFGIFDLHGLWFVRGDLMHDLAALNKVELLPWDTWGLSLTDLSAHSDDEWALLDKMAELTAEPDRDFAEIRSLFLGDARVRVPRVIMTFPAGGPPQQVELPPI